MAESTKYEGHKPEAKVSKVIKEYDMPLKNKGRAMKVKHKALKKVIEKTNNYRYIGDINR